MLLKRGDKVLLESLQYNQMLKGLSTVEGQGLLLLGFSHTTSHFLPGSIALMTEGKMYEK